MKGSFFTLEATIAAVMMIIALFYFLQKPPETSEMSRVNYKLKIYDALKQSDDVGDLRKNALDNNSSAIYSELGYYVPAYLSYNVTVYNRTTNMTSLPSISSENIITVSYFISGKIGNYTPKEIKVFVWGFE